jgi:2-dehydropantoate 2-reductase
MKTILVLKCPVSKLNVLQSIFENANIESYFVENIEETVWEKFILFQH